MNERELTDELLNSLRMAQPVVARRDLYYRADQPLRFMADKIDPKLMAFSSNLSKVAVQAVAERIRLEDVEVSCRGRDVSGRARELLKHCDLPMLLQALIVEMLAVGSAYMIVWVDAQGEPSVSAESAEHVAVLRDPVNRGVIAAVKSWEHRDAQGTLVEEHVVRFEPEKITRMVRNRERGGLHTVEVLDNPLGVVPVVPLVNVERINDYTGMSVIDDLAPLLDALNKLMVDMMTASDAVARPKRYATGVTLEDYGEFGFEADADSSPADLAGEAVAPFKDADDMWLSEQAEAKFGQLPGGDLGGYRTAVDLIMQQIMAVTSLPAHLVGITSANPATAEALRASEVALASNAEGRVRVVNRPVEWAVRMLVAIDQGVKADEVEAHVTWADTATRSVAASTDAAVKLHAEGIANVEDAKAVAGQGAKL